MNQSFHTDYIIVGQGLAGSALAVQLMRLEKKILVIDQPTQNVSSMIAAGLFNPVTGKKMGRTWLADALFPYLHTFYQQVEQATGTRFFYPTPVYRPFLSVAEQNEWMGASAASGLSKYIKNVATQSLYPAEVHDEYGGLLLDQCGFIDTQCYIQAVRTWIQQAGEYRDELFDEDALTVDGAGVFYKGYRAKGIIFCGGQHAVTSRYFKWLPIKPLKGETLTIRADLQKEVVVNRGVYVVPSGDDTWRVGSTYEHHFSNGNITDAARADLEDRLAGIIKIPYSVIGQDAGIRPTTPDRRPMLGAHPEYPAVNIFNGLGTKGISLSPYFSEVLVRWLENGEPVDKEADISRYKSLYWNSL